MEARIECVLNFNMGWQDISKFYLPTHVKTHSAFHDLFLNQTVAMY